MEPKSECTLMCNGLAYMIMAIAEETSFVIHSFCGSINSSAGNQ